jgi:hypothetical protein
MNSYFANIFLAIMQRIQAEVPEIIFIEHDLGELEGYSDRPKVGFPCALVDFDGWSFENMGDNTQTAEGDVVIKLAFAQYGQTNNITDLALRKAALNYYDIEYKLHKALHGWSPADTVGHLTRTSVITSNLPMGVRMRTLRYRLAFEDGDTQPVWNMQPLPPMVIVQEELQLIDFLIH